MPVNVYEAKTHLSRLLRRVQNGEEIIIAAAGRPIARLVPISPADGPRVLGGDEGQVWDAPDFNAPLPDAMVAAFYESRRKTGNTPRRVRSRRPAGPRRTRASR